MATVQSESLIVVQDETLDEARAGMENALQNEKNARSRLELVMRRYERTDRSLAYARRMMTEALGRKTEADRRLDSSRSGAPDYRGETKGEERWQAESRRWGGQAQTLQRNIERWETEARKNEEEARRSGMSDPRQHGILMRAASSARRREQEARTRKAEIDRRADGARRKGEEVRRESKTRDLEIGETQNWELQSSDGAREVRKWSDELRRHESEAISLSNESKAMREQIEASAQDLRHFHRRFEQLSEARASGAPIAPMMPLIVSSRAVAALKASLDNLEHEPEQVLRLNSTPEGFVSLALDSMVDGDRVISLEDSPVILVGFPLLPGLQGKTVNAVETPEGATNLVIS